jgi:hypothetical protein
MMGGIGTGGFVLMGCVAFAAALLLVAIFRRKMGRGKGPDRMAIRRYRDLQGQVSSWSTYDEPEELIEREKTRGS